MKIDRDYQIKEENDTGEEHAKLVLSRLAQNPDKTVNEIIKDTVPSDFEEMLHYAFKRYINDILKYKATFNKKNQ